MSGNEKLIVIVVVMQTIAANLGSMLTPMGNPQNLYLYGISGMTIGKFLLLMLPYTVVSAVLLCIVIFTLKKDNLTLGIDDENKKNYNKSTGNGAKNVRVAVYFIMFVLCILVVVRLLPWHIIAALIFVVTLFMEKEAVKGADYGLLLTFIAFFIFIGNMGEIPAIKNMLSSLVEGREVAVSIISSQAVSNVPAALLLSGFTSNYEGLIIGTNLGGLGTLIASMASLISYKQVANGHPDVKGKYFVSFTLWNVVFLAVLICSYVIMK
jgi:Na+/H+ antiporter NhaD/arsenite permease-like protein